MRDPRRPLAGLTPLLITIALVSSACSSDSGGTGGGDTGTDSTVSTTGGDVVPGSAAISIADLAYEPSTLPVASGSTDITITNADSVEHTFTLDDGSVDERISPGANVTVTVDVTESTGFHCEIHSSMTGTLEVA